MWVQLSDATPDQASLLSYFAESSDFSLMIDFGRLLLYADGDSVFSIDGAFDLADGAWHHVAFTTEESGGTCTYSSYKDGAIVGSPEKRQDPCPTLPDGGYMLLGQYLGNSPFNLGFYSAHEFQGNMTEVRLWRTAKSEAEILAGLSRRINASEAASEPGLVALWPLDCTYEIDDIKGAQHFGFCDFAVGHTSPYSPADILDMECPCPDVRYHRCVEHATYRGYTDAGVECTCDAPRWEGDGDSCTPVPPFEEGDCPTGHASLHTPDSQPA
jgi:hypothetical protein